MVLHVGLTILTVSLLGEKHRLQNSVHNVMPTVCVCVCVCVCVKIHINICLYMDGTHPDLCCATEHFATMETENLSLCSTDGGNSYKALEIWLVLMKNLMCNCTSF
jgi:hypothetical protein